MTVYKVISSEKTVSWYKEGTREYHREDGPAIEYADGSKFWYLNDKCHREDGPAIERSDGTKWWYLNGKRHRVDGPACEYANGDKSWYLNDEHLSEEEWKEKSLLGNKPSSEQCFYCSEFCKEIAELKEEGARLGRIAYKAECESERAWAIVNKIASVLGTLKK